MNTAYEDVTIDEDGFGTGGATGNLELFEPEIETVASIELGPVGGGSSPAGKMARVAAINPATHVPRSAGRRPHVSRDVWITEVGLVR
jgi:hypothetical protein